MGLAVCYAILTLTPDMNSGYVDERPCTRNLALTEVPLQAPHAHGRGPTHAEIRKAKLLVFALAIQHLPEALACGVAFAVRRGGATCYEMSLSNACVIMLQFQMQLLALFLWNFTKHALLPSINTFN